MAVRKNLTHDAKTREKIQTSQLINRLTKHGMGELDLSPTQIQAINILLKKSLPDLQAVEHTGAVDHNVKVSGSLSWQPTQ